MLKTISKALITFCLVSACVAQSTGSKLTITTASLPLATVNAPYSAQLNATGGTQPYTWFIVSPSPKSPLPAGLVLSKTTGTITGTPTAAPGGYALDVVVNDSAHHTSPKTLTLTVQAVQQQSFQVTATPATLSVAQGSQGSTSIAAAPVGSLGTGNGGTVTLSVSALPSGTSASFSPGAINLPGQSTLTFTVGSTTPLGAYPVTVTGSLNGVQENATVTLTVTTVGAMPLPTPPQAYIDTTFDAPTGRTWAVHTAADLTADLVAAAPGDTLMLDSGSLYSGNWTLPFKTNPDGEWIYIMPTSYSQLPAPGTRVSPANVPQMATLSTPNVSPVFQLAPGANHYRIVGLEIRSDSTQGGNPSNNPPSNNFTWCLICWSPAVGLAEPDSITVDRNYIHGSPTEDVGQGLQCNASNCAAIDNYISDIHESTFDSQAILAYWTPGPLKFTNNFLQSTTENLMLGGAGDYNNPYVPSDVVIDSNVLTKNTAWDSCGVGGTVPAGFTLPNGQVCTVNQQWIAKTNLEIKSGRRVAITNNQLQNNWPSGQVGFAVDLTVRTSQSGNVAVVDDVLLQGNQITGTTSGVFIIGQDGQCSAQQGYPDCTTPGEEKRVEVYDNPMILRHGQDSTRNQWLNLDGGNTYAGVTTIGATDDSILHNSAYMADGSEMGWGWYVFPMPQLSWGCTPPPGFSSTHNVWILDNAVTSQPSGDCGYQGMTALQNYLSDPAPIPQRFVGNVLGVPSDEQVQQWTTCNLATQTPLVFDPSGHLTSPNYSSCTTDGRNAGTF